MDISIVRSRQPDVTISSVNKPKANFPSETEKHMLRIKEEQVTIHQVG